MCRRPAHVEIAHRRPILRPPWHWPQEEQLLQRELALEDVAFRQPPLAFEIERGHDLAIADDLFQKRSI